VRSRVRDAGAGLATLGASSHLGLDEVDVADSAGLSALVDVGSGASLDVVDSVFAGGGTVFAIDGEGDSVAVRRSTFVGNSLVFQSSCASRGRAEVENSTFSENVTVADVCGARVNFGFSTFVDNTGVLARASGDGRTEWRANVVSHTASAACEGTEAIRSDGANVVQLGQAGPSCDFTAQSGDVIADPRVVRPLGDNGGPTPTFLLGPASPAVDVPGVLSCPNVDQRGEPRSRCDAGATED
jgi:hypothetical protein